MPSVILGLPQDQHRPSAIRFRFCLSTDLALLCKHFSHLVRLIATGSVQSVQSPSECLRRFSLRQVIFVKHLKTKKIGQG